MTNIPRIVIGSARTQKRLPKRSLEYESMRVQHDCEYSWLIVRRKDVEWCFDLSRHETELLTLALKRPTREDGL